MMISGDGIMGRTRGFEFPAAPPPPDRPPPWPPPEPGAGREGPAALPPDGMEASQVVPRAALQLRLPTAPLSSPPSEAFSMKVYAATEADSEDSPVLVGANAGCRI